MKKIFAKFNSRCAETGKQIKKGEEMYYDYSAKKCYSLTSERGRFEQNNAGTVWQAQGENDFIQDPGEQYFDNFCTNNDI